MENILLKHIYKKFSGFFLLILFCGYLGTITFFPHSHIIEGVTVVHSHPYKSQSENLPVSHNHLKNGFLLIQFISSLVTIVPLLYGCAEIIRKFLKTSPRIYDERICFNSLKYSTYLPRAPGA